MVKAAPEALGVVGFLLCIAMSMESQVGTSALLNELRDQRWQVRRDAFERLSSSSHLEYSFVALHLIKLRSLENIASERSSPDLFEDDDYLAYDERLTSLVENIAVHSGNPEAWRSLVYMRYNADSSTGSWLAQHAETEPFLLEQSMNPSQVRRSTAVLMLALEVTRGTVPLRTVRRIRNLIRTKAASEDPPVQEAALRGLGLIGDKRDLPLLNEVATMGKDPYVRAFAKDAVTKVRGKRGPP